MKAKLLSFLKIFAFLCVGLFLLWLSLRKQNLSQIMTDIKSANFLWVLATIAFAVLSNISRAARWNLLIEPTGFKPRLINTFSAVVIGYFANLAVPRLGEVSRCVVLNRYEKVPMDKLIGTVVVERIVDVIALFILLMLVLFLQFQLLSSFANTILVHPLKLQLLALLKKGPLYYFIVFAVLAVVIIIGLIAFRKLKQTAMYDRLIKLLIGFGDGLRTIGKMKSPGQFIFHSVFIWTAYTISTYFLFLSFGFSSHLGIITALAIMVFGGLGFVAPIPGAVGIYQAIVGATMMLYGLTSSQGQAFANLSWAAQTFMVIVVGILFYLLLPAINRNNTTAPVANETA